MRSLGPGFRFHPTDVELIVYYLKRKVTGTKFLTDGIRVLDVYNFAPWDLPGKARWKRDLKWYFFCPRERKYLTGERTNRSTEHGLWKTTGKDRPVHCNGETVGMKKSLIFHTQNPTQRTNWVMHEYKLWDEYIKKLGLEKDKFVLCVIFEKVGPGPRNGAQYGGPYRDEDWDDDDDCDTENDEFDDGPDNCGEDTDVVGALTQVHTDKGKSIVPNDFERTDGYCVGSSSRTFPSGFDQSVSHGFPPTPVPETLFMDSRIPFSNECGMFVHEILSASLENEQAQDIGAHGCDFLANQNIQPDDYLELADVSSPHDHIGPGQPSPYFGPMIPGGAPVSTLVGQQNLSVGISDYMLPWNGHRQEPAERELPINDPQTGLSRFRSSICPDSVCSKLHIPYLDQCPPVFKGSGEYGPVWQHPQFSDGIVGQGLGDNVPYLNQHHHLASWPIRFGDQYFGENVPYLNPHHQFAQGPVAFVGQSLRENVSSLHGPQIAEESVGLGVHGFEENVSHMNQHGQTADGSIGAHGCDFLANQNIPPDGYLELADVSGPFEGSHDHIGPGQPGPYFGPMSPEGGPVSTLVGQQNLSVGISDYMLSWNGHRQEPAERELPINDPQTALSRFRSSIFPDSVCSELQIPYLDQCPPVFEGSGEYGPVGQHPQFSDGIVGQGLGDNVPYLNQHHHLASWPISFGDQYFGENVPYLNPHDQFAQGLVAFVGQSLRENVSSLHGPQFAEESVGLSVHGEHVSHMNRHGQTADGSIGFHGQEAITNGQMDHHFDSVRTTAPFGIMQPP